MKRNQITLYLSDEDKDTYKAFKDKVKKFGNGISISQAVMNLMKKEIA